jgi:hypothetical protein
MFMRKTGLKWLFHTPANTAPCLLLIDPSYEVKTTMSPCQATFQDKGQKSGPWCCGIRSSQCPPPHDEVGDSALPDALNHEVYFEPPAKATAWSDRLTR